MNGRERVRRAVTFQRPDRIPTDLWTLPGTWTRHGNELRALLKRYPVDFGSTNYHDPFNSPRLYEPGDYVDPWGVGWRNVMPGILGMPVEHPLEDYANLNSYESPYHLLDYGFEDVEVSIVASRDRFIVGGFTRLFEQMQWLRGTANLFIDLAENRPELYQLRDMVHEFNLRYVDRWLRYDVDAIGFSDDWGGQNQLLIRPEIWRKVFAPCYEEIFARVKAAGKFVFFHSDGYILEIIEDLIALGVDALNSQVWCMGVEALGQRFAGRICFWGEVDRQQLLPHGTPDEVHAAIRKMVKLLATPEGGLIGQGEVGPDVPIVNAEVLLSAWNDS
ncbi:MAG TPA: hypothetical protein EYP04_11420 [Anaerolineae bacterium]|nr:hypothetical protein [Anaerolineae bacterium]HIQ04116.1 hypothetical protein [Anaerolineae bacterium]